MGCFNSKILPRKKSIPGYVSSLPLLNENLRLTEETILQFKKGMTIHPKPRNTLITTTQTDYLRPENDVDGLTANIIVRQKSENELFSIKRSLENHFLFRDIPEDSLVSIINSMNYYILNESQIIFSQGDGGYNFFIIASGSIELISNGRRSKVLGKGESFGELALIHDSCRRVTAKTITKVRLWGLGRSSFKMHLKKNKSVKFQENLLFISSTEIFSSLSQIHLENLVSSAITETFEENEKIINTGDIATEMYIIKEGSVSIFKNNIKVNTLCKGDYFGEHSLLYGTMRIATAIANSHTVCLCYTQELLRKNLGQHPEKYLYHNAVRISLCSDGLLGKLTPLQNNKLVPYVKIHKISGDYEVSLTKRLYVVVKGVIKDINTGNKWKSLKCVESYYLLQQENDEKTKLVAEEATVATISRKSIIKAFGITLERRLICNKILKMMNKIYFLKFVPREKVEELSLLVTSKKIPAGTVLFNKGDDGDYCYLVKEGKVSIEINDKIVNTIGKSDYFGERAIMFKEKRAATARVIEDSQFWLISHEDFLHLLDKELEIYLEKKIRLQDTSIKLNDLEIIDKLDKNGLATMYLVCNKTNNMVYALKSIEKSIAENFQLIEKLNTDKNIHKKLNFPFICTLVRTFADTKNLYFLYEYISGPTLESLIRTNTGLGIKMSKFYASVILLCIEYLHSENIIHRAINSQSFLIDEKGYPILTHFLNSKIIDARTYSIVGIPYYMSPEMLNGNGYSFSTDLWSFGIFIYEMLYGVYPFGHDEDDPFLIYKAILNSQLRYPVFIKESMKPKGIIEFLLQKDPLLRGTTEDLKSHAWFEGISWEDLLSGRVKPDFIPEKAKIDMSNSKRFRDTLETQGDENFPDNFDRDF